LKVEDLLHKPAMVGERIGLIKEDVGKFGEQLTITFMPSGKMLSITVAFSSNF